MSSDHPIVPHLQPLVQALMERYNTPGLAIAFTDREQTLATLSFGHADTGARRPILRDTLFEIGSIGKSFTSIVIQQLVDEGRLDLHAPFTDYLPWFATQSPPAPITIHHLLSHTAGIITGTDFSAEPHYETHALRETPVTAVPGSHFHYSNVGYKALGVMLERLLGQPYHDIITERILRPLGMDDSSATITNAIRPRLAVGCQPLYNDRPVRRDSDSAPAPWLETNTGDGCIAATAEDMARYMRLLLNRGLPGVLTAEGFARMSTPVIDMFPGFRYGYGLAIRETPEAPQLGHGGGMVGYSSLMSLDVERGFGIIALCNHVQDPQTWIITDYALRLLAAHAAGEPLPEAPQLSAITRVAEAADYAGAYSGQGGSLHFTAADERLLLEYGGQQIALEARGPGRFFVDHPDFTPYLLSFLREDEQVVGLYHGGTWYGGKNQHDEPAPSLFAEWAAYTGHYRSHNPWYTGFRVVLRRSGLYHITPNGEEAPLILLEDGSFRVGEDKNSPERLRFDTVVEGQALRARFSTCDYYRFFTP